MQSKVRTPSFRSLVLAVLLLVVVDVAVDGAVVEIELSHGGLLMGVERRVDLVGEPAFGQYWTFWGVHYAEPPTGTRRFKPSVKKAPWSGPMTALRSGPPCPSSAQRTPTHLPTLPNFAGHEDCLTLDIYVPYNATLNVATGGVPKTSNSNATATHSALPAMVYMVSGDPETETLFNGSVLPIYNDLIIVVVRHRVGVLGYLATGSKDAPGNLGFLDQRLALEWVRENIALFGGDPNRVTLVGGGRSYVSLHLYTPPHSSGDQLFQRLIAIDGATTPRFMSGEPPVSATYGEGTRLGCPTSSDSDLIGCLQNKTVDDLFNAASEMQSEFLPSPWKPYLDGELLSSDTSSFKTDPSRKIDVILGFSTKNGTVLFPFHSSTTPSDNSSASVDSLTFLHQVSGPYLTNAAPRLTNTSLLLTLVRQQYVDWAMPGMEGSSSSIPSSILAEVAGDISVVIPTFDFIDDITSQTSPSNSFLFNFDETAITNATSIWSYFFGLPILESNRAIFDDEQRQLAIKLIKYSSNFAQNGDPNPSNNSSDYKGVSPKWPPYELSRQHLVLRTTNISEDQNDRAGYVAFWTVTVPQVGDFLENLITKLQNESCPPNVTFPNGCECDNMTTGSDLDKSCSNSSNVTTPNMIHPSNTSATSATPETSNVSSTTCPLTCQSAELPATKATAANMTTDPDMKLPVVVLGRRRLGWTLTLAQASTSILVLLGLAAGLACLVIVLSIVLLRTRSELRRCPAESSSNRRRAPTKKSIRGSGTRWLWRPRDPDDDLDDNSVPFESRGITLDLDESPSMERLDAIKSVI